VHDVHIISAGDTMINGSYVTIPQLAKLLGVSRIAIYKRVKKGQIPATKIGRMYVITDKTIANILGKEVTETGKKQIDAAIDKTVREYGEVLKKLGRE
jgi:excisionase family DNA binding protein